jgi:hypothetical protein
MQILAPAALTEVECILPEKTMAISDLVGRMLGAMSTCTHDSPTVPCVRTPVPEKDACMATTFEHLKSDKPPWSTKTPAGLSITPAMQAVVVDRIPIVNP